MKKKAVKKAVKNVGKKVAAPTVTPQYEYISPARAEQLLNHNPTNRKMRPGHAEKLAHDMTNGTWRTCTAPVVIYEDGTVADGQHRLWAIVESGIGQWFIILRNLDRPSGLHIDTGLSRTLLDNAHISGAGANLSNELLGITRGVEDGDRGSAIAATRSRTSDERLALVEKHRVACEFAVHNGGKKKNFKSASVNAAIARAWYYEADKERLAEFGKILTDGFANGEGDSAAVVLRNYIITNPGVMNRAWRDSFLKAQNAIWYFMRKRKLLSMRSLGEERYPLKGAK